TMFLGLFDHNFSNGIVKPKSAARCQGMGNRPVTDKGCRQRSVLHTAEQLGVDRVSLVHEVRISRFQKSAVAYALQPLRELFTHDVNSPTIFLLDILTRLIAGIDHHINCTFRTNYFLHWEALSPCYTMLKSKTAICRSLDIFFNVSSAE